MKFKKEDLINMIEENANTLFEVIETGDWQDDGKYSNQNKNYSVKNSRCGSYFSYYDKQYKYWPDEVECPEVEHIKVTKMEWRIKK